MTAATKLQSAQRIISLPITRPRNPSTFLRTSGQKDANKVLTYYHFQLHIPKPMESRLEHPTKSRWMPEGGWVDWAQRKATTTWANFGKAPEGTWKLKVFRGGERLVDRLDFEELALSGVDPSLGPTILHPDIKKQGTKEGDEKQKIIVPLYYSPSIQSGEASLAHLRSLLQAREPKHKKGFWMWMIIAPFTAPFMAIPVIPNLPFFFCVWRSWSNYRAYRASQYLAALIEHGHVVSTPSPILDTLYKDSASKALSPTTSEPSSDPQSSDSEPPSSSQSEPSGSADILLTRDAVPAILSAFTLEENAAANMYRAIEQARLRTSK